MDDEPAFRVMPPCDQHGALPQGYPFPGPGMTLRDYFAANVLQGEIASQTDDSVWLSTKADALAERCYAIADAMLEARKRGNGDG